jgi:hypothetical protein
LPFAKQQAGMPALPASFLSPKLRDINKHLRRNSQHLNFASLQSAFAAQTTIQMNSREVGAERVGFTLPFIFTTEGDLA